MCSWPLALIALNKYQKLKKKKQYINLRSCAMIPDSTLTTLLAIVAGIQI